MGAKRNPGYHLAEITKQRAGSAEKIREELEEFEDALAQNCKLMALQELSDLVGAIQLYLQAEHPNITLEDLIIMSDITARAFLSRARQ